MRSPLRRAFAVSTALHFVVLPLLFALLAAPSADLTTNFAPEHVTVASQRITIVPRHAAPHRSVRASEERSALRVAGRRAAIVAATPPRATARVIARAPSVAGATHVAAARLAPPTSSRNLATHPRETTIASQVATPNDALAEPHETAPDRTASVGSRTTGVDVVTPTATPAPLPTATPDAQVAAVGGWGQNFDKPIVADEAALAELRHRYRLATSVSVAVDQSGRAMRVSMPPNVPADVRERLERELLALRYVPAECNGLRCEGTAALDL